MLCSQILRHLPGKRLVVVAEFEGQLVLAKLFVGGNIKRDAMREERGVLSLHRAGLKTPEYIMQCEIEGGARALIFEYLTDAISLEALWNEPLDADTRKKILERYLQCVAFMHEAGIKQDDIHPGNFLESNDEIYIIDGASVHEAGDKRKLTEEEGLDNLAAFLAEFAPRYDTLVEAVLGTYENVRGLTTSTDRKERLKINLNRRRLYRNNKYLKKIFRDCSEFYCDASFNRFLACRRDRKNEALDALLDDPDTAIASGRILKKGNTATVAEIELDDKKLVVKRYNIKNLLHGVRKALFSSRARRSWYNAHLMQLNEIPGARPIALLERKWGPFCLTAYYVAESVPGPDARTYFSNNNHTLEDIRQLASIVAELRRRRIRHGDLKDTNFIMAETGPVLIDLDGMQEHTSAKAFKKIAKRDEERFLLNWQAHPKLQETFARAIAELQNSQF
jgi:tRNA A-37 threonylcarbamoyl transferase component Bud32